MLRPKLTETWSHPEHEHIARERFIATNLTKWLKECYKNTLGNIVLAFDIIKIPFQRTSIANNTAGSRAMLLFFYSWFNAGSTGNGLIATCRIRTERPRLETQND